MDRQLLKDVLLSQNAQRQDDIIPRTILARIAEHAATPFVIIISGVRRCGKSTVLRTLRSDQSYYVNFDDERFVDFTVRDFQGLYGLLVELFGERSTFLFDEIQNVPAWERFVRRLHDERKKVYITGSNATLLSKELGTHLTGRSISMALYPFSFPEFLDFKGVRPSDLTRLTAQARSRLRGLLSEYLRTGGFPEYLLTGKQEYLRELYQNVLYRDIITRHKLPSEKPLRETVYYAASNIAKELSFNTVRRVAGLTSATTVKEYFAYLENSYLAFLIPRYHDSLKGQIYANKKAYFIDSALASIIGFRPTEDVGRMLENLVFLSLKSKGCDLSFYKEDAECDFLVREGARMAQAIQVTASFAQSTERELRGLLSAMARFRLRQGLILTWDEEDDLVVEGRAVAVRPLWRYLLEHEAA